MKTKNGLYDANIDSRIIDKWFFEMTDKFRKPMIYQILADNSTKHFEEKLMDLCSQYNVWIPTLTMNTRKKYFDNFMKNSYWTLSINPINKKKFDSLIDKYSKIDIWFKKEFSVKKNLSEKWQRSGFATRGKWERDFFEYREEFLYCGNEHEIISEMKKSWDKNIQSFLKDAELIYTSVMLSYYNLLYTNLAIDVFSENKSTKKPIRLEYIWKKPIWRMAIWTYFNNLWKPNNCESHLDSSLMNSIIYQQQPWLEIQKVFFHKDEEMDDLYKPVEITNGKSIVFGWREGGNYDEKMIVWLPHKVNSDTPKRTSIWFDLNPADYITHVKKVAHIYKSDFQKIPK